MIVYIVTANENGGPTKLLKAFATHEAAANFRNACAQANEDCSAKGDLWALIYDPFKPSPETKRAHDVWDAAKKRHPAGKDANAWYDSVALELEIPADYFAAH